MTPAQPTSSAVAAPCALGLDIGGTKMAAALVKPDGTILEKRAQPTLATRGGAPVLEDALQLVQELQRQAAMLNLQVAAIGIGLCELVDTDGHVLSAHTLQWRGLPIQASFAQFAPSHVDADARAAAFAEARCGAGRDFRSFLYVTVGTGIGSSWVMDGVPFPGYRGCSGTLASGPTSVLCPACGEVRAAVVEEIASGSALVARFNARAGGRVTSAEEVLQAASAANADAEWVVETAVECLASTLGLLINMLDPAGVVIGGGLGSAPGPFWQKLPAAVRRHIWSDVHRDLPIVQASLGPDSGVIGAALLAWARLRA